MLAVIQIILLMVIIGLLLLKELPKLNLSKTKERLALLDSCALIDGRIVELAKAGFVPYALAVPEFIVAELQLLADGSDSHKRERARFGLEVVQQLQQEQNVNLQIERTKVQAKTTDDKLVKLAKLVGADLYTTDFNLNQVASIEGVRVLNVNELSHALRPVALPGENFEVKVLQAGSNRDQGVGYMEDGTMIVIDNARRDIGKKVKVNITRTHQTVAGKMLFAQKVAEPKAEAPARPAPSRSTKPAIKYPRPVTKPKPQQAYKRPNTTSREASLFREIDKANSKSNDF